MFPMHGKMRGMVDDEKKSMLEELLKQMYHKMADGHGEKPVEGSLAEEMGESPEEEAMEHKSPMASAEHEELGDEGEDDEDNEVANFMKNKHKPHTGKGVGVMIKVASSKPIMKSAKRK